MGAIYCPVVCGGGSIIARDRSINRSINQSTLCLCHNWYRQTLITLQHFNTNTFICVILIIGNKVLKCVRVLWALCVVISGRMNSELRSAVCPPGNTFWLMWLPSSCVPHCICAQMYPFAFLNPPARQWGIRYICNYRSHHTLKRICRCQPPAYLWQSWITQSCSETLSGAVLAWSSFTFFI